MDTQSFHDVSFMTQLVPYLRRRNLRSPEIVRLASACHNRAVLLIEVQDLVLQSSFRFNEREVIDLRELNSLIAVECRKEMDILGRHLPPPAKSQSDFPDFPEFSSFLKSTVKSWSYTQFCASVPAPTGFQLAEALRDFFREDKKVAESQRRFERGWSHDPKSPL